MGAYTRFVSLDLKNALRCSIPFGRFGWKLSPQLRFNCQDPQLCWHRSRERQARKDHLRAQRKDLKTLIAEGHAKLASMPAGGSAAPAAAGQAAAEAKKEEKKEESEEEDDDMGFGLFDYY